VGTTIRVRHAVVSNRPHGGPHPATCSTPAVVGGSIVLGFSLILLDFPYRLLAHDIDFDEVTWEGRSCHVLGAVVTSG
jgi:hypothetical protein